MSTKANSLQKTLINGKMFHNFITFILILKTARKSRKRKTHSAQPYAVSTAIVL